MRIIIEGSKATITYSNRLLASKSAYSTWVNLNTLPAQNVNISLIRHLPRGLIAGIF